jgi:hypothetical protein
MPARSRWRSSLQHTSRNGDPQLRPRAMAQQGRDRPGWQVAVDRLRGLHREQGRRVRFGRVALETGLTRRFGFEWAYRPASKGRVIAGFPEKAIAKFSSAAREVTKAALALAEAYEKDRGHAPERALASMRQFANARTRRAKEPARWTSLRCCVSGSRPRARPSSGRCATWREPSGMRHPMQWHAHWRAETHERNSREWPRGSRHAANSRTRKNARPWPPVSRRRRVTRRVDSRGPGPLHRPEPSRPRRRPGPGTRMAAPARTHGPGAGRAGGRGGLPTRRPRWPRCPRRLRRANGESVYRAHGGERYATRAAIHGATTPRRRASEGARAPAREQPPCCSARTSAQLQAHNSSGRAHAGQRHAR